MNISARVDYGVRALLLISARCANDDHIRVKADEIARAQGLPIKFLEGILSALKAAGIIVSHRGADGGYRMAQSPAEVSIADVVRALDGPLAAVRGQRPEDMDYQEPATHLRDVWVATRGALRSVLEHVSLQDILDGKMPPEVQHYLTEPGAWKRRAT